MPMRRAIRLLALALCPALLLLPAPAAAVETPPATDPAAVLENARKLYKLRQFAEAAAEFERASQLSGGHCGECLVGMAQAYSQVAALLVADRPDDKTLAEAEADLRKAVALDGQQPTYRLQLAHVLILENRTAEGLELAHQAAASPEEEVTHQARLLICKTRAALPPSAGGLSKADVQRLRRDPEGRELTAPQIVFRIQPQYTEAARKQGIEGKVVLESIIDEEGCVRDVNILQSLDPGLDEVARTVLQKWIFKPATFQGKPVKVYYSLTINFALDKKEPSKPF